ncbi:MAG: sulfate transporter CysZ [Granulosicoccus sp.]|nr:sulfate transporter CysZ [Granulosicoccus sp.]
MKKTGFLVSASYVRTGWHLIRARGLKRYVLAPLLINLLLFTALGWWAYTIAGDWLQSFSVFQQWGDWWIVNAVETLLRWIVLLVLVFALTYLFTLLANLIAAPFNGLLAERVEAHLTGKRLPDTGGWSAHIKNVPRLIGSELSKLLYLILCMLPLLLLHFIPVVNLVAPLLLFLFGAWMFALEYLDYPMGNHGAVFREVRQQLRKNRSAAFGFGTAVAVLSMVPLINLIIMPVAVAGATALYVDQLRFSS